MTRNCRTEAPAATGRVRRLIVTTARGRQPCERYDRLPRTFVVLVFHLLQRTPSCRLV